MVMHNSVLNNLMPLLPTPAAAAALCLVLSDFVPFVVTARVVGGRAVTAVDKVAIQQAVGAAVVVDPGPEDAEIGLQGLEKLVDDIAAGHRVVAEGVVRPFGRVIA